MMGASSDSAFGPGSARSGAAQDATRLMKALSHEARLEILCSLIDREQSVGELEELLGLPQAQVSQHLRRLRAEGLVRARRDGRHVMYRLDRAEIKEVVTALRNAFCPH